MSIINENGNNTITNEDKRRIKKLNEYFTSKSIQNKQILLFAAGCLLTTFTGVFLSVWILLGFWFGLAAGFGFSFFSHQNFYLEE
jgi:hypothetical protein